MLQGRFHPQAETSSGRESRVRWPSTAAKSAGVLEIGLVNNMPEAAFAAAERQFAKILGAVSDRFEVRLRYFMFPERKSATAARSARQRPYESTDRIESTGLDALIVTGSEPMRTHLQEEPYWESLTRLVRWAERNTISALWSCLAAHAAVLCLDGIERRTLARKRTGVFPCEILSRHPLVAGVEATPLAPHSRFNELREQDLREHDYEILTRSGAAGVDAFIRGRGSLFVFLQGHPEYEPNSLLLECRRDFRRWLAGETQRPPAIPVNYFDAQTQAALQSLSAGRSDAALQDVLKSFMRNEPALACSSWERWSSALFGNWLTYIADEKSRRHGASPAALALL